MNGDNLVEDQLRDIQGYQSVIIPNYVWWILIALALILIAFAIYKFVLSRKKEVILTIYEKTILAIDELDMQQNSKDFYLGYSDIVRSYLLERLDLNLFDKTLNELRFLLDKTDVFELQSKNQLVNIFAKADMAKFAKRDVSQEKRLEHLDKTKEILAQIEKKLSAKQEEEKVDLGKVEI